MRKTYESPLFSIVNNDAVYVMLAVFVTVMAITKRDRSQFVLMLPVWMTILTVIAGPCIAHHSRYVFPVLWSWPLWTGAFAVRCGEKRTETEKNGQPVRPAVLRRRNRRFLPGKKGAAGAKNGTRLK